MATKPTKPTAKPVAKTPVLKTEAKPATEKKVEKKVETKVEAVAKPAVKPAAKPAPAVKAEKPAAKKPTAKKTASKKPAAKPAKPIKTNLTIEFAGKSKTEEEIVKLAKKAWKKSGKKMADIKTIDAFVQPENNCVYCVVNGEELGAISLDGEM